MGIIDSIPGFGTSSSVTFKRNTSSAGGLSAGLAIASDLTGIGNDAIQLDCGIRELHELEGSISSHPVETGVDIVDNYRVQPRRVEIEGVITDQPIISGIPFGTTINAVGSLISGDTRPSLTAWAAFKTFFAEGVVVDITTSLDTYVSMGLSNLIVTRDALNFHWLRFTCNAEEIRFVSTETTSAFGIAAAAVPTGQATQKPGRKPTKPVNEAQKNQSIASRGLFGAS